MKPLIEKIEDLEAFRSEPLRGNIASQIITDLVNSDIVVADLTDHNPNVMWELGVRQGFKCGTITIAEVGTQIPFHFSHKSILFYNGEHLNNQKFEDDFLKSLSDCIEKPEGLDSPVIEIMGGRGTLYSIIHAQENKRKLDAFQYEIKWIMELLEIIYNQCLKNKAYRSEGKKGECKMVTARYLPTSAIKSLYINRYLDLNEDFYKILHCFYVLVLAANKQMEYWQDRGEYAENWILINQEDFLGGFKQISEYLKELK